MLLRRTETEMMWLKLDFNHIISRVSNQNGVSLLYIEGSGPEWYISTIYHASDTPFWLGTLDIMFEIHHSGQEPSISYVA